MNQHSAAAFPATSAAPASSVSLAQQLPFSFAHPDMVVQLPGLTPGALSSSAFAVAANFAGQAASMPPVSSIDRLILAAGSSNPNLLVSSSAGQSGPGGVLEQPKSQSNSVEASPGSSNSNPEASGDAEGVWSADIDQAFHEALQIYPPCGRRKIILSDEGKMYGRNELIARYIKIRCGKTRTRKQVSSHIQVLARKKQRDMQAKMKGQHQENVPKSELEDLKPLTLTSFDLAKKAPPGMANLQALWPYGNNATGTAAASAPDSFSYYNPNENMIQQLAAMASGNPALPGVNAGLLKMEPRDPDEPSIATAKLALCGFEAYVQQPGGDKFVMLRIPKTVDESLENFDYELIRNKYPPVLGDLMQGGSRDGIYLVKCWANVDFKMADSEDMSYAVDSFYDSQYDFDISVSTKVCSFAKQVVEKVEVYSPVAENRGGKSVYNYRLENSPMCEYMVRFIAELKKLDHELMNSVLENFTVLQVVTNRATGEVLMAIAFIFVVSPDPEPTCRIYRVVNDGPTALPHTQSNN